MTRQPQLKRGACSAAQLSRTAVVALAAVAAALAVLTSVAAAQSTPAPDLDRTLARASERIEAWYARAQSIVAQERVVIQPLEPDLTPAGFPRRLAYELRVAWDAEGSGGASPGEASVVRQLVTVNGRPAQPDDEPGCMDPKPVSPEPLAMLMAPRRAGFRFSMAGTARVGRRQALTIDYRSIEDGPADIQWQDDCVTVSLPGRSRGRIWIDAATHDVLRLDERLTGMFEFDVPREYVRRGASRSMVIERSDTSIRYRHVEFDDPMETLLLPASIETVTIIKGSDMQRVRITQQFSNYRRFLTSGRIVE